ncbi:MAG: GNAT family N-acetyltransferase [Pseudonocardiaceae bacterium]
MSRISLRAVAFDNSDARALVTELYADQLTRYDRADPPQDNPGDYAPPHGLFLLLCLDDQPAGCGGYRIHDPTTGEIKRLYVRPEHRGQGHGQRILTALEHHAHTLGSTRLLLETGARNKAAIALFTSTGYTPTPGYVPHRDHRINRAFTKSLPVPQQR